MRSATRNKVGKSKDWLAFVHGLPCVVCVGWESFQRFLNGTYAWRDVARVHDRQRFPTEAAHVGDRGLSQKCHDEQSIPLCGGEHHREGKMSAHKLQKGFWSTHGLNREQILMAMQEAFRRRR